MLSDIQGYFWWTVALVFTIIFWPATKLKDKWDIWREERRYRRKRNLDVEFAEILRVERFEAAYPHLDTEDQRAEAREMWYQERRHPTPIFVPCTTLQGVADRSQDNAEIPRQLDRIGAAPPLENPLQLTLDQKLKSLPKLNTDLVPGCLVSPQETSYGPHLIGHELRPQTTRSPWVPSPATPVRGAQEEAASPSYEPSIFSRNALIMREVIITPPPARLPWGDEWPRVEYTPDPIRTEWYRKICANT